MVVPTIVAGKVLPIVLTPRRSEVIVNAYIHAPIVAGKVFETCTNVVRGIACSA